MRCDGLLCPRCLRNALIARGAADSTSAVGRSAHLGSTASDVKRTLSRSGVIPNNVLYTFGGLYEQQQIAFRGLTVTSRAFRYIRRQGLRCYFGVAVGFVAVSTGAAVGEAAACAADDGEIAGAAVGEEPGEG